MIERLRTLTIVLGILGAGGSGHAEELNAGKVEPLEVELSRRDPVTGEVRVERRVFDTSKVGVVVDVWNWHWCKTATARVAALVPRMNRALEGARKLGITVMLCPTDVVDNVARYPSVVFKIYIDGRQAAESPVMRIAERPWRFDLAIPAGARLISLVATDAGDGNREDLANWVDAGFLLKPGRR